MHKTLIAFCFAACAVAAARSAEVSVAVAANFAAPMQQIAQAFEQASGHHVAMAVGATGKFYTQIHHGAPFQLLLAADDDTPARLEQEGLGVAGTRFTYAVGKLVLWSSQPGLVDDKGEVLRNERLGRIAIADPKLAPYGAAAVQTLDALGLRDALQARLVVGENIAQAFQFVASGNAQLGFIALSQVMGPGRALQGSAWEVPATLHNPIRQDVVLLQPGRYNAAAQALLDFLRSDKARTIIHAYGYAM